MEVKDVQNKRITSNAIAVKGLQRPLSSLSNQNIQQTATQTDATVFLNKNADSDRTREREKVNKAINARNQIQLVSERIGDLVNSIDGIVEQASSEKISPRKRELLEKEGNELVDEIKSEVRETKLNEISPFGGDDDIRTEIEQSMSTIRQLLPDGARDAFGIGQIKLDEIVDTRTKIAAAQKQINELREAVGKTSAAIGKAVEEVEVALANTEASQASIRDVEEALRTAEETKLSIGKNPEIALSSFSKLEPTSLELLEK